MNHDAFGNPRRYSPHNSAPASAIEICMAYLMHHHFKLHGNKVLRIPLSEVERFMENRVPMFTADGSSGELVVTYQEMDLKTTEVITPDNPIF